MDVGSRRCHWVEPHQYGGDLGPFALQAFYFFNLFEGEK